MVAIEVPLRELELATRQAGSDASGLDRDTKKIANMQQRLLAIVESANDIFVTLQESNLEALSQKEITEIAERLESHVALQTELLKKLEPIRQNLSDLYIKIDEQSERLDSWAETLRMATDPRMRARLDYLVDDANRQAVTLSKTNWRDFVTSLHD